jgi:hypothetical protein
LIAFCLAVWVVSINLPTEYGVSKHKFNISGLTLPNRIYKCALYTILYEQVKELLAFTKHLGPNLVEVTPRAVDCPTLPRRMWE